MQGIVSQETTYYVARATITRRLCTIAGFYRYAVEEELFSHSPAAHVRRLRLDYESHATGLDRNELGALLVAAGLGHPADGAVPLAILEITRLPGTSPVRRPGHAGRGGNWRRSYQARSRWYRQRTRLTRESALVS
jgi:hypothetical protein